MFDSASKRSALSRASWVSSAITGLALLFSTLWVSGQKAVPEDFCISPEAQRLGELLNDLRKDYGKSQVKFSVSLSYVAAVHVKDLYNNHPDTSICNLSSWSDKGTWTACCHNAYVPQQECMWSKPKELTPYPFRGYELAAFFEQGLNADSAMALWSGNKESLDMILTEGDFKSKNWQAVGVAIYKEYVSVWFGQRADNLGVPGVCTGGTQPIATSGDTTGNSRKVNFYLIIASFTDIRDAREALKRYRKSGYENAGILTGGENIRVYLDKYKDLKEVMFAKQNSRSLTQSLQLRPLGPLQKQTRSQEPQQHHLLKR